MSLETPVKQPNSKRVLTSPDDHLDPQKNRVSCSPDKMDTINEGNTSHISLSQEDLAFIAKELSSSFHTQMESMVSSIVEKFIPQIVRGVEQSFDNQITSLEKENEALRDRVSFLEDCVDKSEQYSRRNCLRVSGISEDNADTTDDIVLTMANAIGADLSISEIDRSHRVGKLKSSSPSGPKPRPRDIIVKFVSYRSRQKFYSKRAQSKSCGYAGIFINEDLTRKRSGLLYQARSLKKEGIVLDAWSSDGVILVRDKARKIHTITSTSDLSQLKLSAD